MNFPPELIQRITISEGIRLVAYRDSRGSLTIGIGHNVYSPITVGAAQYILRDDLTRAVHEIQTALPWAESLDSVRYWSLVELAFNMGIGVKGGQNGLLSFDHMLAAMQAGRWNEAAGSLLNSAWHEEVGDERADRIANQIRTGNWA
jgi:lysozyme